MHVPLGLQRLRESQDGATWLTGLPSLIDACRRRWGLRLGIPYEDSYVSWVSRAWLPTGEPTILKIQFPHEESRHEGEALLRWGGDGAVRLVDHDPEHHALLIEPCVPGHHLSTIDPGAAIEVMTGLLPRLWIPAGPPFRSLADEAAGWVADLPGLWDGAGRPFEESLLDEATTSLTGLATSQGDQVLIHQDLHGDNVLAASREPWLVVDPKPLAGEREFSLAPIIRSHEFGHGREAVLGRLDALAMTLDLDRERARLWTLGQTLAWAFDDGSVEPRHLETARWLAGG